MNDAADEPSKPTSAEPGFRKISDEELRCILDKHEQWVAAEDKTGLDHLRADLSFTDLREQAEILKKAQLQGAYLMGAQLRGADLEAAHLAEAQLQGAILLGARLQGAELEGAQLQEAILIQAQLPKADLAKAQLQGANLAGAQLQWASLVAAQLQGAILLGAELQWSSLSWAQLQGANLGGAQLQGASLFGAQLQETNLRQAQLQGANLFGAQLRQAMLIDANFERLTGLEDGGPGQECSADLTNADFRDADLSNAQLSTVAGLRAEMLAGAVLTNAKLPDDIKKFDKLTHVAETSRIASTVFFGLLAASLYSWLTIATTTDVALITGTASSPLPIINTNIALSGFYLVAPLILIAVYFYFHLYLQRLWGDLASLPAVFPDGEALDGKAYPWLLNGLVRAHFKKLELAQRPLTRVENVVSILLAWWVVPFTLLAFWLRFLPRHEWLGTSLHVVLIAGAAWFGVYSYQLAVQTLRGDEQKRGDQPLWVRMWRAMRRYRPGGMEAAGFGVGIVVMLSIGAAIDPGDNLLNTLGYDTYAELTDEDISTKPSGWTGQDETAAVEIAQVKGADLEGRDLRQADARRAFLVRAKLGHADLRGANLGTADLRGADFSFADLRGADFSFADLRGANLRFAVLYGADLGVADLRGAYLGGAPGLTQAQLDAACGDDKTHLPQRLTIKTCGVTAPPGEPSPPPGSS